MGSTQSTWDSYIHSYTMRVVSIGVMLALGLALALPQYKEQDMGQQGKNLDNEGPHQNNEVKLVPSFDAVKDAAEDELEEDRDNHLEQEPMVDAVKDEDEDKDKDDQDPRKCAKEDEGCCHGQVVYGQLVNGYNGSMYPLDYDAMIEKDKEGFEFRSKICKEMGIPDCCEGYWCDTMCYSCCRKRDD